MAFHFHPMLFQQVDTTHHLHKRWLSHLILPILVMKFLRTINRDAYQKIVLAEKNSHHSSVSSVPLVWMQLSIVLASVYFLQSSIAVFIKDRAHLGFTSMPSEQHGGMVCDSIYSFMNFSNSSSLITWRGCSSYNFAFSRCNNSRK